MASVSARMRRITSDWEQLKKDFDGHKNIVVLPVGDVPPEKYHVTYYVKGLYLLPNGQIEIVSKHEVEIILHSDYPRYKPICRITTPIWHPNFKDGQICIGDIWGAGESLTDIIIDIGNMIQYKSWNSSSPLSAEAAKWALENQNLFPVGDIDLQISDKEITPNTLNDNLIQNDTPVAQHDFENDFEITFDELADIELPATESSQDASKLYSSNGVRINIKTIFQKGIIWALIGAIIGFGVGELLSNNLESESSIASIMGYDFLSDYYKYDSHASKEFDYAYSEYETYCESNGIDISDTDGFERWYSGTDISDDSQKHLEAYASYYTQGQEALEASFRYEFASSNEKLESGFKRVSRNSTAVWSATIALFIGLFLGIGEGMYYGSKDIAWKYGLLGAGISALIGYFSGYIAQTMYGTYISDTSSSFNASLIRALGWALMGAGVGLAIGLIKPEPKRIFYCSIGGITGAFIGGFLFNYICDIISMDIVARCIAIIIMGGLIGIGVGLLEQFAKQAWLKVVRGEFEGKEYLVFSGITSIGNNGKNSIVLFKDKLIEPHHCDIIQDGGNYVIENKSDILGVIVNGVKVQKQILRNGDTISLGNTILVFNAKR